MEITWKLVSLCLALLFFQLCNGFPINLENATADSHTQLLTGLVAVLLTVCSIVFLAGCLCCQRRNGFKEFRDSPVVASSSNLDHGHINPVANGEFTIFTPLSPSHHNNNVFLANQQIITRSVEDYGYDDLDVSSWFDGTETDFPRIKLKYIRELGRGWFGKVVEGAANNSNDNNANNAQTWTPVVVRILEATATSRERVVFLHDAIIYRCGPHPNILALIGRCLDTIPLLLLQEYCPQGDLKKYLKENKPTAEKLLSTEYPLIWCCQLTSALKHLHDHKITHPDLATRNCQLTTNLTLKLGDYGLSVFQYPEDYYEGLPGVPVRWCAPESLQCTSTTIQPKKTTTASNVWSLGVTMWEIYECGQQPYSSLSDDEVVSQVFGSPNVRLTRPSFSVLYTDYIFRLMQLCWTSAESRPAVSQIDLMLADLLQVHKNTKETNEMSIDDFDKRWESFKPNAIVKTDNELIESDDSVDIVAKKELSPSLNNLHGSLDNLLINNNNNDEPEMESWLENVATNTQDLSYIKGLSDAMNDLDNALAMENISSSDSSHQDSPTVKSKIDFKLGPITQQTNESNQIDSLTDSMIFVQRTTSSESETEDENWRKKVECGAYTEKVRLKSRSVADLMVLTHVDCSDTEPDTSIPSLDFRITNFKNVRYPPKTNFETVSLTFGSEGNLLNVENDFEVELRKLQEERRDSLLFVPDKHSQIVKNINSDEKSSDVNENEMTEHFLQDDSPSKRLMQQLNSPTTELKPVNQVFNVFNVTIDNFSPIHVNSVKMNEIILLNENHISDVQNESCQNNSSPFNISLKQPSDKDLEKCNEVKEVEAKDENNCQTNDEIFISAILNEVVTNVINISGANEEIKHQTEEINRQVPKLYDLIQNNDELMDYIIAHYDTDNKDENETELKGNQPKVAFDLSASQDESTPNSLTHLNIFGKSSLQDNTSIYHEDDNDGEKEFSSNFVPLIKNPPQLNKNLNYSLETWDNFLQNTLTTNQNNREIFDSFSSEPNSILFTPDKEKSLDNNDETIKNTSLNDTFDDLNTTYVINKDDLDNNSDTEKSSWETGGGWFLHPQNTEDVSGEITQQQQQNSSDSYVGFGMDDEIMAAIRNELLTKLPHAQGSSNDKIKEDEEWETAERNEVFLGYNVYNTPLSPIPEESIFDESETNTPKQLSDDEDNSECWDEPEIPDIETQSVHTSPMRAFQNRHTPSQESCCSNDTLFNLEELTCATTDNCNIIVIKSESPTNEQQNMNHNKYCVIVDDINNSDNVNDSETLVASEVKEKTQVDCINEFLNNERKNTSLEIKKTTDEQSMNTVQLLPFLNKNVAPLPSPEDKPWKQLPASLLCFNTITSHTNGQLLTDNHVPDSESPQYVNGITYETTNHDYNIIDVEYENTKTVQYENLNNIHDIYNEADYVNIVNLENSKNISDCNKDCHNVNVDDNFDESYDEFIINNGDENEDNDYFGVLTDIRFNGPTDNQLMSTSFSESNDLNDERDWDSGSDTRSSSSGEFIWKEGEHEESLKALRAAPQDVLEDIKPMDDITEEGTSDSSDSSTDDECETPEFVPSAWDKYAIPTKSALRSPEKTMEKTEKKSKGVWFKKQKYHCVYEYPREPESPVLQSQDLWKPQSDFPLFGGNSNADDEFFISGTAKPFDMMGNLSSQFFPGNNCNWNMDTTTPDSGMEDITPDYHQNNTMIPKSVQPLKYLAAEIVNRNNNNQKNVKINDTFGGLRHTRNKLKLDLPLSPNVFTSNKTFTIEQTLEPIIREKPTFSTFGKSRFMVQHVDTPPDEAKKNVSFEALPYKRPINEIKDETSNENASIIETDTTNYSTVEKLIMKEDDFNFDRNNKTKVEFVRGEASLLDSADEDSGIESSTLERKLSSSIE